MQKHGPPTWQIGVAPRARQPLAPVQDGHRGAALAVKLADWRNRMKTTILLDLNFTLSEHFKKLGPAFGPAFEKKILEKETFRDWLVEWLRESGLPVFLFTVRNARYRDATLRRIAEQTGWSPDDAYFNDTGMAGKFAAKVKSVLLDRVLQRVPANYLYSFESNPATRAMLKKRNIRTVRIAKPQDLPTIAKIRELETGRSA